MLFKKVIIEPFSVMEKILSSKYSDNIPFPGVYIFYQNDLVLYVGYGDNVSRRLVNRNKEKEIVYEKYSRKGEIGHNEYTHIRVIICPDNLLAQMLEQYFIRKLKPRDNKYRLVPTPGYFDLDVKYVEEILSIDYKMEAKIDWSRQTDIDNAWGI